jgi:fructuronate reductase
MSPTSIDKSIVLPQNPPESITIGIVHFGIGAFHRAHQAVFTADAMAATGDTRWGILGVTGRNKAVVDQLRPQGCVYGVLSKSAGAGERPDRHLRLISAIREVAWPAEDSAAIAETVALPTTHLITLTITEKGYLRALGSQGTGSLDLRLESVAHDLDCVAHELAGEPKAEPPHTAIGMLVCGLARRFRSGGPPITILSCDNIVGNGEITRELITAFVANAATRATALSAEHSTELFAARAAMLDWLTTSVTFPSSMVDRITPATLDADRAEAAEMLGLWDDALVVAEPFNQWVIEDKFAGPRPAWEKAGVIITDDVPVFERAKLRVLNSTHSTLAYLGLLRGYPTIAEAIADPALAEIVGAIIDKDILPTLTTPPGLDLHEYRDSVLARFRNASLPHTTRQVAMDGSQKLPNRTVGTIVDRLAAGHTPHGLAVAIAAWIAYLCSTMAPHGSHLDDPMAAQLQETVRTPDAHAIEPEALVTRIFALHEIFPPEVQNSVEFQRSVVTALGLVRQLTATGTKGTDS